MHRILTSLALFACVAGSSMAALAQPAAPELSLTRLDCGTSAAPGRRRSLFRHLLVQRPEAAAVFSCYLIRHGDDYMMWDTGHSMSAGAVAPKASIVDQLAQLKVKPEQIKYVGISHYHGDHTGQVGFVPAGDAADRQGRLGRADRARSRRAREPCAVRATGSAAPARSSRSRSTRTCSATARSSCSTCPATRPAITACW